VDAVDPHIVAEERSIAMHVAVAEKVRESPEILEAARRRVAGWEARGSVHRDYVAAWMEVLGRPVSELCAFLVDRGERATAMRQVSPFAGALTPRERWAIHRRVGRALSSGKP